MNLKLNSNGLLNKNGHNIIYQDKKEIAQMGVNGIDHGTMYMNDFMSLYEVHGYGKMTVKWLFSALPKINVIELKCKDGVLSFWTNCGGVVTNKDKYYNTVTISRKNLENSL
jgi:hypothetical protein